jgi:O-antigen/teichoic acid export membrane protein
MSHQPSRILKHAGIYLIARGLPGLIAFVAIPVFSRLLDPAGYGKYALVLATVGLLNALLFQWLRLSLVRYLAAANDNRRALKSTLLTIELAIIVSLAVPAAAVLMIPALVGWRAVALPCLSLLAVQSLFELFLEHARAQIEPWRYMTLLLSRSVISTALGAGLIVAGMGWWGPVIGLGVGMLLPGAWAYARDWRDAAISIDRAVLRKVCTYGLPLSMTVALAVVISTSDRFLIAWLIGDNAAGLYSVAVDFTNQTITLLMMVVYLAMFPLAIRAWENEGRQAAEDQMRHNATLLLGVGVPAVIGLAVLSPGLSHVFLGKSFRTAASQIMPLVALGSFLAGLKAYHFDAAFQFVHQTIHQVWIVLVAAVFNLVLNLLVIRRYGINGAAAASVCAYIVSIALTVLVGRRHFALPFPGRALGKVLLAGAAMAAVLVATRSWMGTPVLVAQVVVGALLYGAVLVLTDFLGLRSAAVSRLRRAGARKGASPAAPGIGLICETGGVSR